MAEIKLERLTKHFGEVKAVENLDLVAEHGSFIALLGPSGCGKTTTMNMISGLEKPTEGEIYFDELRRSRGSSRGSGTSASSSRTTRSSRT